MSTKTESLSRVRTFRLTKAIAGTGLLACLLTAVSNSSSHAGGIEMSPVSASASGTTIANAEAGEYQLLMIHAAWCGPCRRVKRDVLPKLGLNYGSKGREPIYLIDSGQSPQAIKKYGVKALPTFILLHREGKDWQSIRRSSGALTVAGFRKTFPEILDSSAHRKQLETSRPGVRN